jgi:S1-C subfamily serine protease
MRKLSPKTLVLAAAGLLAPVLPAPAANVPEDEPAVQSVQKAMPAVVNIATERVVRQTLQDPAEIFFNQFFGGQVRPRELRQKVQSLGSGFIIDAEGYIVTNEHVVERAADLKIQVTTGDGKTHNARYIAGDPASDLALIKIEGGGAFPFISLGEPSPNLLGQTVLALGNPLGYGSSVSRGILSATNRTLTVGEVEYRGLLQTDAAINPGNSGGPLIDLAGRLVGMNSVKMAYTPQGIPAQGMGFAIPAGTVHERVAAMRAKGLQRKGGAKFAGVSAAEKMFGLSAQELTDDLTAALGYDEGRGVLVSDVEQGGPADRAGLTRGLVIYRVGKYDVNSVDDLERVLARAESGQVADFTVGSMRRLGRRYVRQIDTVQVTAR